MFVNDSVLILISTFVYARYKTAMGGLLMSGLVGVLRSAGKLLTALLYSLAKFLVQVIPIFFILFFSLAGTASNSTLHWISIKFVIALQSPDAVLWVIMKMILLKSIKPIISLTAYQSTDPRWWD